MGWFTTGGNRYLSWAAGASIRCGFRCGDAPGDSGARRGIRSVLFGRAENRPRGGSCDVPVMLSPAPYTGRMLVRRLIAASFLICSVSLGVVACSTTGPGTKSECDLGGCTITFDRGVEAEISVLGVNAELTAVEGNTVTLTVAGRQVAVPVGESRQAEGMNLTVREVTPEQVVVEIATGL